jgi:glycosyltransferase involved in cell wall biosynthesis
MSTKDEILHVAHLTNVIDGRSNSGTARAAKEIILKLSEDKNVLQTFIHFEESDDSIYRLPNTRNLVIPLSRIKFARHFYSFLKFWVRNLFTRKIERFDVVHWHTSRVYPFFYLIPSKRTVITLHDATSRIIGSVNTIWTRVFYWNLRISESRYDYIIGDSVDACSKLVQHAKFPSRKVKCVYLASNFADLEAQKPAGFALAEDYILCVSRWQPYKNVSTLISAYSMAMRENQKLPKLVLVGKPVAGFDHPQTIIEELELEERILVLRDLKDQELAFLYDHALFSVNPSLHEGFGLSVLEGLKRGCPSVNHVDTATAEISGSSGIPVDMKSPELLSKILVNLFFEKEKLEELRKKAKRRAAYFTWETTVKNLKDLYMN